MPEKRLPRVIWILGLASLSMDLSSEMIHSLLPVFLVSVLGVGAGALGLIEGVAEATASIAKVFSGVWSDHLRRRKPLVVFGYGLAALVKPLFPLANSAAAVMGARFADRLGKGIRGARAMPWSPTSRRPSSAAQPLDCARPSTRSAHCSVRWWRSDS